MRQVWYAAPPVTSLFRLPLFWASLALVGCTEGTPPASPSSDVRDVRVHRADDKPDFIRLERDGDAAAAVAIAWLHGADAVTSRSIGDVVADELSRGGYQASVTATEAALLVSASLPDSAPPARLLVTLRRALGSGHDKASVTPRGPAPFAACGSGRTSATPTAPHHRNTVLAAVGTSARLTAVQAAYDADTTWASGTEPTPSLPETDEYSSSLGRDPAELVVSLRTPLRERVVPAARLAGASDSLLNLLAESHDGRWRLLSSHASFMPAGGCLSVHLSSQQPVAALHAARAAKAIRAELEWSLAQQTTDEDPRFNVLEAPTAEESARRAAWEAMTRYGATPDAPTTAFVHYRGDVDSTTWKSLMAAETTAPAIPMVERDEPGQGRVWALLDNPCAITKEDNLTAGHASAALLAASRGAPDAKLDVVASWEHLGLVGWQPTHGVGAEDRLAEAMARSILEVLRSPGSANQLARQPGGAFDTPPWTLALTLATNGHPSWLTVRPTPQSRAVLDAGALEAAMRGFVDGPLRLSVLTNHGQTQSARFRSRLSHLLSGVHTTSSECPAVGSGGTAAPAGEYDVEADDPTRAVALYVVDRRFATAVRRLADALNEPTGWLRRAVQPLGAEVVATGLGTPTTMAALGFTVSAETRDALEAGLSQLRVLVADLPKAPATSLTTAPPSPQTGPVDRLTQLAGAEAPEEHEVVASVRALIAEGLTERRLFIVRPLAHPKTQNSSNPK